MEPLPSGPQTSAVGERGVALARGLEMSARGGETRGRLGHRAEMLGYVAKGEGRGALLGVMG